MKQKQLQLNSPVNIVTTINGVMCGFRGIWDFDSAFSLLFVFLINDGRLKILKLEKKLSQHLPKKVEQNLNLTTLLKAGSLH